MNVKRTNKRRDGKVVKQAKVEAPRGDDFARVFRLDQPLQTALYAKLCRLGYSAA